jgi:hypothetical protein
MGALNDARGQVKAGCRMGRSGSLSATPLPYGTSGPRATPESQTLGALPAGGVSVTDSVTALSSLFDVGHGSLLP